MFEWYADFSENRIINKDHKIDSQSNILNDGLIRKSQEQKKSITEKNKAFKAWNRILLTSFCPQTKR